MLEGEYKAEVDRRVRGQKTSMAAILARKAQVYITDCKYIFTHYLNPVATESPQPHPPEEC